MMENRDYSCWHFGGISSVFFFQMLPYLYWFFFYFFSLLEKWKLLFVMSDKEND